MIDKIFKKKKYCIFARTVKNDLIYLDENLVSLTKKFKKIYSDIDFKDVKILTAFSFYITKDENHSEESINNELFITNLFPEHLPNSNAGDEYISFYTKHVKEKCYDREFNKTELGISKLKNLFDKYNTSLITRYIQGFSKDAIKELKKDYDVTMSNKDLDIYRIVSEAGEMVFNSLNKHSGNGLTAGTYKDKTLLMKKA